MPSREGGRALRTKHHCDIIYKRTKFSLEMRGVVVNVLCYIQQGSLGVITELTYYIFTSMYDCQHAHVSMRYTDLNLVTEVQFNYEVIGS